MATPRVQIPSVVEEFFRQNRQGRCRMLALTYEFDPAAFERAFAWVLKRPIQVDVVAGKECDGSGTRARFWRACWPGTFHPKMICLLANTRVSVGLGSANLTSGGLREHLEIWRYFEGEENRVVLGGVRELLKSLDERKVFPRAAAIEEFIEAMPTSKPHALLTTLHGSLLSQVVSRVSRPVRHVDILTPINCDPTSVVKHLRHEVGGQDYRLYTDKEPVPYIQGITKSYCLERPERDEDRDRLRAVSVAHPKIYAFDGGKNVDLFWGSANLSYSAWLAQGERANADFLVHTRTSSKEWSLLRDKSLPKGHKWKVVSAKGKPPEEPVDWQESGWRLLHAYVQNGEVWLEANRRGSVHLLLRQESSSQTLKCLLRFTTDGACLPSKVRTRLGFRNDHAPKLLWWKIAPERKWFKIPVNSLDVVGDDRGSADLAQQLFWEFAGRLLPRPGRSPVARSSKAEQPNPPDMSPDEDELTKSEHQGELDRFVLEWRAIARRVAQSCRGNDRLRKCRIASIMNRIDLDANISPKNWPELKRNFVRQLLERPWRA